MSRAGQFYIKLLIFLLPVTGLLAIAEWKLHHFRDMYSIKKSYMEENGLNAQVVVLGASHAYYGLNPQYFSSPGFNMANVAQSLDYDIELMEKYVNRMPHLKLVIFDIDYFTMYSILSDRSEDWRKLFYYHYWGIKYAGWSVFRPANYSMIAMYSPGIAQSILLGKLGYDTIMSMKPNGCCEYDTTGDYENISDSLGKKRVDFHNTLINTQKDEVFKQLCGMLNNFLAMLQKRNIKAAIIKPPVYETYSKYCNVSVELQTDSVINNLQKEYGCAYFDYSNDKRFDKKDFYDNDHVNCIGARKFSRIVDSNIVKPLTSH